jgi:hypothetical protein
MGIQVGVEYWVNMGITNRNCILLDRVIRDVQQWRVKVEFPRNASTIQLFPPNSVLFSHTSISSSDRMVIKEPL